MTKIFSHDDLEELGELLKPWADAGVRAAARNPEEGRPPPNSQPLGENTGAPPRTRVFHVQVPPGGVQLVGADKYNRAITVTPPDVGFGIFLGPRGRPNPVGFPLIAGVPYEIEVPGFQELWASTNSPVLIPVLVKVAPLLVGDRERRWEW